MAVVAHSEHLRRSLPNRAPRPNLAIIHIVQTELPYLTRDFPGIGGVIKQRAEDFFVQEIPLYEPSGQGEHVYCEIQKVGLTTFDAINQIARALNVSSRDIGYAGVKDARAVTRQVLSIFGTNEAAISALQIPNLTILWAARHDNKLRIGHLSANRFAIRIPRRAGDGCRKTSTGRRRNRQARHAQLFRRATLRPPAE